MRKRVIVFIIIMFLSTTLAGCWDIKYLDQLSIVMAIGMDISEDNQIEVTVQVVKPAEVSTGGVKSGGGGATPVHSFSEKGETVMEALRKISNKISRNLYLSHNQVLVIGEDLARKGISRLFEMIERDPEVRTNFYALVAKGAKASDILKISTPLTKIPGVQIHDTIENVEKNLGTSFGVRIKDILENIGSGKQEIIMGAIEINGDIKKGQSKQNNEAIDPQTSLQLNGIALFKEDKLVDFLKTKESRGVSWIYNKIKGTVIKAPCKKEKQNTAIEIIHSSTSVKAKLQHGQPSIVIHVKQEANVGENLCPDLDLSNSETFKQLEEVTEEQIQKEIKDTVTKAQELNTDIFGFAKHVYKVNPAYWEKNKRNWDEIFSKIAVQVVVETEIKREGLITKSLLQKNK